MNLIEQYGGYENLKSEYLAAKSMGFRPDVLNAFEEALMEYRRANNIFEVGDFVLRKDSFNNVLKITGIDNGCADLVRRVDGEPRWSRFNLTDIRHATDAEIKAGKRL